MSEDTTITNQEVLYACEFIVDKIKSYDTYTVRSVKKHYPKDWAEIITFGTDNIMFHRDGDILSGTSGKVLRPFDTTPLKEPKVDLHGADVVIDEIEPLKVPDETIDVVTLLNKQNEILERIDKWMSEVSLVLKENMSLNYFESRINKRMDDMEANFKSLKEALTMQVSVKGPEVTTPPLLADDGMQAGLLQKVKSALGSAEGIVKYGYKEVTGNYWISLKKEYKNLNFFNEVKTKIDGLGFTPIMKDFFFLKKTRS